MFRMRSRLGIIIILVLLLLTHQCFALRCRTCSGDNCLRTNVELRTCTVHSSLPPVNIPLDISDFKNNFAYGCLKLESPNGRSIDRLEKCLAANNLNTACQIISEFIKYTVCSIEYPSVAKQNKLKHYLLRRAINTPIFNGNVEPELYYSIDNDMSTTISPNKNMLADEDSTPFYEANADFTEEVSTINNESNIDFTEEGTTTPNQETVEITTESLHGSTQHTYVATDLPEEPTTIEKESLYGSTYSHMEDKVTTKNAVSEEEPKIADIFTDASSESMTSSVEGVSLSLTSTLATTTSFTDDDEPSSDSIDQTKTTSVNPKTSTNDDEPCSDDLPTAPPHAFEQTKTTTIASEVTDTPTGTSSENPLHGDGSSSAVINQCSLVLGLIMIMVCIVF